ncbi:MAG: NH(3)-dependent NAD(+) synthetase [Methanonatronarchaeales archaeon]|nr:NH(3)-dependent NAD(+) synthetase [Methanonatronarchaeales archaeon]
MIRTGEEFCTDVSERIEDFIREVVEEAGARGAVVAMSGGVDSSLVAVLASKALARGRVFGIGLPGSGTGGESGPRGAENLAGRLGINWRSADIEAPVRELVRTGSELAEPTDRARINVAPRVRMALTYFVANSRDLLVLGTGNRSELLLGYFTKYGDGSADLLPIGGLYKTQVFALGEHVGVPEEVLEREPSAELYPGQVDRDEIGFGYGELDPVLHLLFDSGLSPEETASRTGLSLDGVESILEMVDSSRHKREFPPVPGILREKR